MMWLDAQCALRHRPFSLKKEFRGRNHKRGAGHKVALLEKIKGEDVKESASRQDDV